MSIKKNVLYLILIAGFLPACKKEILYQKKPKPEITLGVNNDRLKAAVIHLTKDTVYYLASNLNRDSGQSLEIDAGTLIKVNDFISITINPGATIEAKGTANEPVVFTSSAYTGVPGPGSAGNSLPGPHYWNGIWIFGSSTGISSGILNYVRIEFAGGFANQEYPSLLLKNVSPEMSIENIQVSYSYKNPSFEFWGGNCNARNLVSYASTGADFYIHQGYTGMLQNLLAYRHPYFPNIQSDYIPLQNLSGMLIEDLGTFPIISNLTVLGPGVQTGTSKKYFDTTTIYGVYRVGSLVTLKSAKFHIANSVLMNFPMAGWFLDDKVTGTSIINGESDFTYSIVHSNDSNRVFYLSPTAYPPFTSVDFKNYMLKAQFANVVFDNADDFMFTDPYNYDVNPDPLPMAGSPVLNGASFSGVFTNSFFNNVSYRGALGTDNWLEGWSNFIPLQTKYNF